MSRLAPETHTKTPDESILVKFNFANLVTSTDGLTGTPTVVEISTTALSITNTSIVETTKVQALVANGLTGNTYKLKATTTANTTPNQTLDGVGRLTVETAG